MIDMNVKYEFLAPTTTPASSNSNSIYFDQVLLRRLQEETSGSPVLLNTRTESRLPTEEETSGSPVLLNTRTESRLPNEFQLNGRGGNSPFRFTTTASSVSNVYTTTPTTTTTPPTTTTTRTTTTPPT